MTRKKAKGNEFDAFAFHRAMDEERMRRKLGWRQVAQEIWDQSAVLNRIRQDHPISPATLTGIGIRGDCTCQHALFILRWLGRSPESFMSPAQVDPGETALPAVGADRRLRWDLSALYEALNTRRCERALSWADLAAELRCTPSQLTGIRKARFAIGMRLAMRIVAWLERPAASFVYAAKW
jgi:hypothetical protein